MYLKYFLIVVFLLTLSLSSSAKHILGGEMHYECIAETETTVTLRVTTVIYRDQRDPEGAQCDDVQLGVWFMNGNSWEFVLQTELKNPEAGSGLDTPENPPCADAGAGVSNQQLTNEQCTYVYIIELDKIDQNYLIAYQRCCRNGAISNIVNPEEFGAAFSVEITPAALAVCNSSPVYNPYRTAIFCINETLEIDNFAQDADGDSVVYEFCIPISAGGMDGMNQASCNYVKPIPLNCGPEEFEEVTFIGPLFSFDVPLRGDPDLTLNPSNGLLRGVPVDFGEYVMAVCATEYRDGVLFSKMRRDIQVVLTDCTPADALLSVSSEDAGAILEADENGNIKKDSLNDVFLVRSCGDTEVEFDLGNDSYQSETFYWEFDLGNEIFRSDSKTPRLNFPGIGIYEGFLVADPESPPCSDTADVRVEILPTVTTDFDIEFDNCRAGNIVFEDLSSSLPADAPNVIQEWNWNFGDGNTSSAQNPTYRYSTPGRKTISLSIIDNNGCNDEMVKTIDWFPVPEPNMRPDGYLGCAPQAITFNNLSTPLDSNYTVEWDFGDGSEGPERFDVSPVHIYTEEGEYDVTLKISSPVPGCEETREYNNIITVLEGFDASFDLDPEIPRFVGEFVNVVNTSDPGATSFVWEFGEDQVAFTANPSFVVRDTGVINVKLTATWDNGCSDTSFQSFSILPCLEVKFPNAFTPNGDGRNEVFKGLVFGLAPLNYRLVIFDRWGKIIFETTDPDEGWNGREMNTGANLPPGVYLYKVSYSNPACDQEPTPGFATLIR